MKRTAFLLSSLSILALFLGTIGESAAAIPALSVVMDKPQHTREWRKKGRGKEPVRMKCLEYPEFAVVEENDPNEKGAVDVSLRLPARKGTRPSLCENSFNGKRVKLPIGEVYLVGARGNFIFTDGADSFGSQLQFEVFDAKTGKKIYSDERDSTQEFLVRTDRSTAERTVTSLQYYKTFRVKCGLADEKRQEACWSELMAKLKIPSDILVDPPTCGPEFKKANSPVDNVALVGIRVSVPDLDQPKMEYIGRRSTCTPSP